MRERRERVGSFNLHTCISDYELVPLLLVLSIVINLCCNGYSHLGPGREREKERRRERGRERDRKRERGRERERERKEIKREKELLQLICTHVYQTMNLYLYF